MEDPLAIPTTMPSLVSTRLVPNVFPTNTAPYRIAIVGDAPGKDEEAYGLPFVGAAGRLLDAILGGAGIDRTACFVGNVCQHYPPAGKVSAFGHDHPHITAGLAQLRADLELFQPNVILALGDLPMWAFTGKPFGIKGSGWTIDDAACYVWPDEQHKFKLVASYHPQSCFSGTYSDWYFIGLAAKRAKEEGQTRELVVPTHSFELDLSCGELCARLDSWPAGLKASIDIEGGILGWICMSVVCTPRSGFIVAFGEHTESEQARLYRSISRFLHRTDVPKVMQNGLYEGFVLGYAFNMSISNMAEDTMLQQWELFSELPKGLSTVGCMWTREPQWKFLIAYSKVEQKRRAKLPGYSPRQEIVNKHLACCIDSSVTLEGNMAMNNAMTAEQLRHYRFNMSLLQPLLYMELAGIAYDKPLADQELAQVKVAMSECATRIESRVLPMQFTKTEFSAKITGEKGSISSQRLAKVLYEQKNYPIQKTGRGPDAKPTTDTPALLKIKKKFPNDPFLSDILLHRKLESIRETLEVSTDPDGRVRCGYNLVGTETGRLTCYTSPTGSGANLQTITKKLRKLYVSDAGYFMFQCDLSGADGWTVAARCLTHGDSTMWDDYTFGLKPAKILALMYEHGIEATNCTRDELKIRCATVDGESMIYFACKRIQHGTNYGMQETTMAQQIMEDSYKMTGQAIYIEPKVCAVLQQLYLKRYRGVTRWHDWARRELLEGRNSTSASGHTRIFYGRRKGWNQKFKCVECDQDTWRQFLANEPQENTTYACNMAAKKLWEDLDNRIDGLFVDSAFETLRLTKLRRPGGLYIPPTHQVHDALLGQIPKDRVDWAVGKIQSWFQNELTIANTRVIIPFEGAYGPSWGEQGTKYGGGVI